MKKLLILLILCCGGILYAQNYQIGDLYTASDGSRGVVYYLHPDGSGGWVVALNDASTGCAWGASNDVPGLANQNPSYYQQLLNDTAGYANTQVLRNYQNNSTTYAAGKVDFAHGWVLPSPAQLSMLYGQLPFIASAITGAGGTALASANYWSSAEKDASNAWFVNFTDGFLSSKTKTTSCRVRAVRSFSNTSVVYDTSLTYQWNTGSTQPYINVSPSQTTTYTVTGTTDYGCSTTAEQTIIVGAGSSQTIYDTVCQGAGYEANGFTVTEAETGAAGTLTRNRTLETEGCSSNLTLQLMVKSPVAELVEATACGSYTWNGVTYYESGEYTQTFTAANGCDSVVTLRLTIHHGTHNAVTETACDSYEWHDSAYTTSGVYTYEYTNADGCPSVDTLHLTITHGTHQASDISSCESYEWHGITCDTSGTYTYEYTNGDGCLSADTLHFTRKYAETAEFAETACESYEWNGTTYTESGDYSQTFTAASGCDSVVTLHLTVNHSVAEFVEATACESYTWNDSVYTASGDYPRMFTAANGCDSVITLHLTVNQTSGSLISASLVENSLPCMLNGSSYMEPGTYYQHFTNAVGCDSTLTLQITVYYNQTVAVDSTVCGDALPVVWNDSMFTSAGTKTRVYPAANGADSIVVMTLHVNPSPVAAISGLMALCADSAVTLTADSAYSYLWSTGDTTQVISVMEEGFYTLTVTNEYGCEAVTVHQLSSLGNPILSVTAPDMCAGGSYTFSVGRQGSDNIHLGRGETTLSLADTVFLPDGVYCEPQGCSYRSPLTFAAYAPGSTIQSADDIHYVRLNMEHSYIGDLYINITCPNGQKADLLKYGGSGSSECNNQIPASSRGWAAGDNMPGYIFLGNAYDYNVNSCDPSAFGNEPGEGWNYCWSDNTTQGYTYSTGAGGYIYRFVNATSMGADDIVDSSDVAAGTQFYHPDDPFSNLIGCPLNGPWYIEVQDGWSSDNGYIFGWELALSSEMLPDMPFELAYATADGPWITALSDSLFQIDPPTDLDHDTTIVYTFTVYDTTGCAYDTTVSVNFYATRHTELDTVVCEGFVWNDSLHTTSGQYVRHFVSAVGCDSVSTLNLTVNNPTDTTVSIVVLENALPYQYNDSTYVEAGTYTQYLTNAAGCDSILTVLIDVIENVSVSVDSAVCETALPLTWNDSVFTAAGTKTTTIQAHTGADSTITMTLTVIPTTYSTLDTAIVENALPLQYNEISYVEAGTYTQYLTNVSGCDSVLTLTLAVFPNVTGEDDSTICASELPLLWNGVTFTQAGTQTTSLVAATGADSVVTMTLTVIPTTYGTFDTAIVENALPYQYNEISYVEAGTYTQHLTNAAGCDSILTLTLTVFPNVTTELDSTVCESDLPVIWNGIAFTAAGTDSVTLLAATGADSTVVMTLHVVALPVITHSADTVIMPGASVNLWATGADIMAWTDADGNPLSSGGNLTVAPTVTTTYYITAFNEGNSVVTNGDFESGNAGFTTAYQYNSNLWPEGNYYVGTNAHNHHGNFPNWYDHTTGSGLYMIVNGATVAGTNLWTQTVPVIPHTSYAFSAWVCTLVGGYSSLARLQFSVNATQLGEIFHSPSSTSVWNRYYEVWYSGENTTATLTILNQNTTGGGNDFGVDDIQFSPLNFCNVTDSVTVYVSGQTDSTVCADALPLLWNGVEFTTAGTQTATITTPDGSDSVVVMTLHVNALSYSNFDTAVVENTLPLQYNGILYIEAGTYTQHLTNAAGCDSVLTVLIDVIENVSVSVDSTVCEAALPLTWNDSVFTAAGTKTTTILAHTGADSTITMTLTVIPTTYSIFDTAVVENALPLQYNGISYVEAGTYTQYFTNALGCDSILTIHLTVYQNVTSTVDTTVCAADLPYTWHGHNFTAAGTHMVTLFTSHGADSTVTYHLSVDNITANIGNVTHITCYGESTGAATASVTGGQTPMTYVWTNVSGTNIATTTSISNRPAGAYTFTVTDHVGCTATATVTLNTLNGELTPGTIAASQEVCDGEDIAPFTGTAASGGNNGAYQWQISTNGTDWTPAPGTNNAQTYTYPNSATNSFSLRRSWVSQSCGTVYSNIVTVSVWPNSSDTISASICQGEIYDEYNFNVPADQTAEAGEYTFEQHHATGHCDSAVILLLTVNPVVAELVEATVCEGEGYDANGFSVSPQETIGESVLTRVQNLQTVNGCDSVVTLQLTIIDTALRVEMLTEDFCEHNEAALTVLSPMQDYVWSTGETATTIVVTSPGLYSVTAMQGGCSSTATIRVEGCHYELVLPNAITPSRGDGLNDCFYIPEGFIPNINLFKVYIYNRWGELVFYSTDKNFRWYGEYRGQTQYQTIYNYVIEYTDMAGRPQKRQGPITVL